MNIGGFFTMITSAVSTIAKAITSIADCTPLFGFIAVPIGIGAVAGVIHILRGR